MRRVFSVPLRLILLGSLLFATPLLALKTTIVDDVIRMSRAGVAEQTILDFVKAAPPSSLTADDVIAMKDAGVPKSVVDAMLAMSEPATSAPGTTPPAEATPPDDQNRSDSGPIVSLFWPWCPSCDPAIVDPWWFMPQLDTHGASTATRGRGKTAAPTSRKPASRISPLAELVRQLARRPAPHDIRSR